MGRRSGKKPKMPPFVGIPWEVLNSTAYRKLPPSAAKALAHFMGKPRIGYGNAQLFEVEFPFSYREARRYGFSSSTFFKVIRDLIAYGFIDQHTRGGLRSAGYSTSTFRISRRWQEYGRPGFEVVRYEGVPPERNKRQLRNLKQAAPFSEQIGVAAVSSLQEVAQ